MNWYWLSMYITYYYFFRVRTWAEKHIQKQCQILSKTGHELRWNARWANQLVKMTMVYCIDWNRFMMRTLMSTYRCAQLVRHVDSLELNLLPGVLVMHLSQHTFVIFPTISLTIAFCFSCCRTSITWIKFLIS